MLLLGAALHGCANRGMQLPDGGRDGARDLVAEATGETPGDVASEAPAMDSDLPDSGPGDDGDGGEVVDRPPANCPARFNFENGALYGAIDNNSATCATCLKGFTAIANSGTTTFCGYGALEITAAFSGTTGPTTGGEVVLPLNPLGENLTTKTISINVTAVPKGDVSFFLILSTGIGYQTVPGFPVRLTNDGFSTKSYTFTAADGGVAGMATVMSLSLEAFSYTGYTGKIIVDEIDIK